MTPSVVKHPFERLLIVAALLFFVTSFVECGAAVAQETGGSAAAGAPADDAQSEASGEVAEVDADGPAAGGEAGADAPSSVLGDLMAAHGISADEVATVERVAALESRTHAEIAALEAHLDQLQQRLTYLETSSVVLDEQLDDGSLPAAARQNLARKAAIMRARFEVSEAMRGALGEPVEQKNQLLDLLAERTENLRRENSLAAENAERQQARLEQAEAAEKAALAEVERARVRESRERDDQVRRLIAQRRTVLEEIAQVARHQTEQIQGASQTRAQRVETFAKHREEVDDQLGAIPASLPDSQRRNQVDPLFEQVLDHRREVRESLLRHEEQLEEATDRLEARRAELRQAEEAVAAAREELAELGESVVVEQKVMLAEARRDLRERQIEANQDIAQARQKQLELDEEQLEYYNAAIERLLPRISAEQRDDFYSIFTDENWRSAWFSVRQAASRVLDILETRAEQFVELPERLVSVSLWGWVLGVFWRLMLIAGVIYVGRHYTDPAIRRMTSWALRRRFFQRNAGLTIKAAEVLRSVIRPIVLYFILSEFVGYVVEPFPELVFLQWAVDAAFVYWVVMLLVKVMVLPRHYREKAGRTPAPDLARIGAHSPHESLSAVDVISIELTRATKLVRSVRIILAFWLLEHYVPLAVTELLGHSVLTWLIKTGFMWGLAIVVYMVLVTWKDDIAALFERLARDRRPRAVDFVHEHKDRFYGVLVIAVASVYVLFHEIGRIARAQAKDTEWSKRVSNFVFRKRIEMQQKERGAQSGDAEEAIYPLPDDYRQLFEPRPLVDENFKVSRREQVDEIIAEMRAFHEGRPQGSLAMTAEQGMGKTSLLNDVARALSEDSPDARIEHISLADRLGHDKFVDEGVVLKLVADLFELDEAPATRTKLCQRLGELEPRVMLIDDCHHLFVREIGGFSGLDVFLEVVNLTDDTHYWALVFNKYAWNYINRVRPRQHYFGRVLQVRPWTEREIQELIQRRNALSDRDVSFTDLVVAHEEGGHDFYEIVKTANGYFRLLHEFSGGNPMVALRFWMRSIKADADGAIQVSLFRKPSMTPLQTLRDEYLFALAAIAQHGALDADELADIINTDQAFCEMALNYFEEREVVELDASGRRAHISPLYFRQVVKQLTISNFLWD